MEAAVINHITSLQIQNPSITTLPIDIISLLTNSPSTFGVIVSPNNDKINLKSYENPCTILSGQHYPIPHLLSGDSHSIFEFASRLASD